MKYNILTVLAFFAFSLDVIAVSPSPGEFDPNEVTVERLPEWVGRFDALAKGQRSPEQLKAIPEVRASLKTAITDCNGLRQQQVDDPKVKNDKKTKCYQSLRTSRNQIQRYFQLK